jgi:hypothetical protein
MYKSVDLSETMKWLQGLWRKNVLNINNLSDEEVRSYYIKAGHKFSDTKDCICKNKSANYINILLELEKWELEYSKRGFRTFSINDFIKYYGFGSSLDFSFRISKKKREPQEKAILHIANFRKKLSINK